MSRPADTENLSLGWCNVHGPLMATVAVDYRFESESVEFVIYAGGNGLAYRASAGSREIPRPIYGETLLALTRQVVKLARATSTATLPPPKAQP